MQTIGDKIFGRTGNIVIIRKGVRELIGQYADGAFIVHERYRDDARAQKRIAACLEIAVEVYGKPTPAIVYKYY